MTAENSSFPKLLRLHQVLDLIPISKSAWWAGIKTGKYPPGRKLSERTTVWLSSDIQRLIENLKSPVIGG